MKTKSGIALFISISAIIYIITFIISSDYIVLNGRYKSDGENIFVIAYYLLLLPIFSSVPCSMFVFVRKVLLSKTKDKQKVCMVGGIIDRVKTSGTTNMFPFWAIQDMARSKYWAFISCHLEDAIIYMSQHPESFYFPKNINDKPQWEEPSFREDLYINGEMLSIYIKTKTFMIDLNKCVEYIKSHCKLC